MAKVTISNGEVTKHLGDKGFVLETKYKTRAGEEITDKWTVWGKQPEIGTVLEVEGDLTIKTEEYNGTRYARGHINNPVFRMSVTPPAQADPFKDAYPQAKLIDDGAPF